MKIRLLAAAISAMVLLSSGPAMAWTVVPTPWRPTNWYGPQSAAATSCASGQITAATPVDIPGAAGHGLRVEGSIQSCPLEFPAGMGYADLRYGYMLYTNDYRFGQPIEVFRADGTGQFSWTFTGYWIGTTWICAANVRDNRTACVVVQGQDGAPVVVPRPPGVSAPNGPYQEPVAPNPECIGCVSYGGGDPA